MRTNEGKVVSIEKLRENENEESVVKTENKDEENA